MPAPRGSIWGMEFNMNWFTASFVTGATPEKKAVLAAENDCCDHVSENPLVMFAVWRENDSFGSEGYCLCEDCYEAQQNQIEEEVHTCNDCNGDFTLASGGILWKWYDFYAAQGDEELPVCGECRKKNAHLTRLARDRRDREQDWGEEEDEDDDD